MDYFYYGWKPYVSAAARRAQAARELSKLRKNGRALLPVQIAGRKIATTFWGKAWCENLERYSDFANRLPRGRTYLRNGSVLDLQIARGAVAALVSGSQLYTTRVDVTAVAKAQWRDICRDCTGAIDSLVELLQGQLSTRVITRICEPKAGLFPEPKEVSFACSCPDGAWMCKHVAAVLYGVGARLDERPELLFLLRGVDQEDLIATAGTGLPVSSEQGRRGKVLESEDLSQMFDIEIAAPDPVPMPAGTSKRRARGTQPAGAKTKRASPPPAAAKKAATATPRRAGKASEKAASKAGSPAWRKAVSERMKAYWAQRRQTAAAQMRKAPAGAADQATSTARPAKKPTKAARATAPARGAAEGALAPRSDAWRKAVSERMKKYWAGRRRRSGT